MPMHDWTKVEAGIFHAFHHNWIFSISTFLNAGNLPSDYYALPEQVAVGLGPDVLTLQSEPSGGGSVAATAVRTLPQARFIAESDAEAYRRKKNSIVVRHISGDRVVAVLEIVSPGNKSSRHGLETLVSKACELLERRIHLVVIDPFPPSPRDPQGVHAAIWERYEGDFFELPPDEPLAIASYECGLTTRAFIEPFAVGRKIPAAPLFLEPGEHILTPLEATYQTAFAAMPKRWRSVLETDRP